MKVGVNAMSPVLGSGAAIGVMKDCKHCMRQPRLQHGRVDDDLIISRVEEVLLTCQVLEVRWRPRTINVVRAHVLRCVAPARLRRASGHARAPRLLLAAFIHGSPVGGIAAAYASKIGAQHEAVARLVHSTVARVHKRRRPPISELPVVLAANVPWLVVVGHIIDNPKKSTGGDV